MIVYHFRNASNGIRSITEGRLKIGRLMDLNDPFEFLGIELSNSSLRHAMNQTKKELSEGNGLLCFNKKWNNPLHWAHYADSHKGICMGFKIPNNKLEKITYVKNRIKCSDSIDMNLMKKCLFTKFKQWEYEQEYRFYIKLDKNTEENGLYFFDFGKDMKLTKVIVGCRSELSRKSISNALGDLESEVEVFKARPAFKTFSVVRNKDEKRWA
jgi:hypothetical protein